MMGKSWSGSCLESANREHRVKGRTQEFVGVKARAQKLGCTVMSVFLHQSISTGNIDRLTWLYGDSIH